MYKSKLQELAQKKAWGIPSYESSKQGPSHDPCFKAIVTVNGVSFETLDFSKHLKEARNEAARLAYIFFSENSSASPQSSSGLGHVNNNNNNLHNAPSNGDAIRLNFQISQGAVDGSNTQCSMPQIQTSPVNVISSVAADSTSIDMRHTYKGQLQTFVQKRNLGLPEYSFKREGLPHASRFSCTVKVADQCYEIAESFSTVKEAEHAAAKVALMALLPSGIPQDISPVYKNVLQEFAQKEGYPLPTYSSKNIGLPHLSLFVSTVEVQGEIFEGEGAKTKKQAEMNAAKLAYITLMQRQTTQSHATFHSQEASGLKSNDIVAVMLDKNVLSNEDSTSKAVVVDQEVSRKVIASPPDDQSPHVNQVSESTRKRGAPYNSSPSAHSSSKDKPSPSPMISACNTDSVTNVKIEGSTKRDNLPCKKVCVYHCNYATS